MLPLSFINCRLFCSTQRLPAARTPHGQLPDAMRKERRQTARFFSAVKRQLLLHARYCRQKWCFGSGSNAVHPESSRFAYSAGRQRLHPIALFEFSSVTTEIRVTGIRGENLSLMRRPFFWISSVHFPRVSKVTSFPARNRFRVRLQTSIPAPNTKIFMVKSTFANCTEQLMSMNRAFISWKTTERSLIERKTRKARRTDKLKRVWTKRRNVILWRILSVGSPQGENERKGSVAGQFSRCPVYTACAFQLEFCKINVM